MGEMRKRRSVKGEGEVQAGERGYKGKRVRLG